jgi:hypothetical protein
MLACLDRETGLLGDVNIDKWPREGGGHSIGTVTSFGANGSYQAEHNGVWNWHDGTRAISVGAYHHYWSDIRTGYFLRFSPSGDLPYGELHQALNAAAHDPSDPWPPFLDLLNNLQHLVPK